MSDRTRDVIRWVIERMMAHEDSITQELALIVEREARIEWGGQRIDYIARRCRSDPPDPAAVVQDYASSSLPAEEVAQRHGISRATLYRMVKQR